MNKKQIPNFPQFIQDCRKKSPDYDFYSHKNGESLLRLFEVLRSLFISNKVNTPLIPHSFKNQNRGYECKIEVDNETYKNINPVFKDYGFNVSKSGKNIIIKSKQNIK